MFETGLKMNLQFHAGLLDPPPANPPAGDPPPATPPGTPPGTPQGTPPVGDPPPAPPAPPANDINPKPGEKDPEKPVGAPEKYGDFKLPEGMDMDTAGLGKATELFKKHNLTQEQAQEFVSFEAERIKDQMEAFNKTVEGWEQETIKLLGPNREEELAHGARFRDEFLSPETQKFFTENKLFNHPGIVMDFIKAGKAMAEDKFVTGKGGKQEPNQMQTFFPNSQIPEAQK